MNPKRDYRLKLVVLPARAVFDLFRKQAVHHFAVPTFPGLPDDIEIIKVAYDLYRDAFVFTVEHPSFDIVPEATIPPEITIVNVVVHFNFVTLKFSDLSDARQRQVDVLYGGDLRDPNDFEYMIIEGYPMRVKL